MVKVITGGLDKLTDEASPEIQQQTSISAVINGHHSAGIVVMKEALQLAVAKARSHGCAVIGTNHTATGSGAIGYITQLKHAIAVNLQWTYNLLPQLLCLLLCAAQAHYLVPLTGVIPLSSYPSPTVHTDHQALSSNSDRGTRTYHTEPLHTHANMF